METRPVINRRPGTFWRILQFPVTRIVLAGIAIVAVDIFVQWIATTLHIVPRSSLGALFQLLMLASVLATYCVYVHAVERRPVREFGRVRATPEFLAGFLVGAFLFGTVMLVLWLSRSASISMAGGWRALGYPLIAALATAVAEETLVRGVLFRIIEENLGSWIALAISAAAFGAMHAANPGATLVSSVAIALEAGVLLAAVFMYTRRLWMAIGLHAAWNFTEGGVFGASVSGGQSQGAFVSQFAGAQWLTGGKFGPEASLVAVLVCVAAGLIFLRLAWKRGHFIRPAWLRKAPGPQGRVQPVKEQVL